MSSQDFAAPGEAFSEDAISLVNAEVMGALMLAPIERTKGTAAILTGSLDLKSAYIRVLVDSEETWPRPIERLERRDQACDSSGWLYL